MKRPMTHRINRQALIHAMNAKPDELQRSGINTRIWTATRWRGLMRAVLHRGAFGSARNPYA